jgi:hypothetical protein
MPQKHKSQRQNRAGALQRAHNILLDFSLHDYQRAETVHTLHTESIVIQALRDNGLSQEQPYALNHEYGEVLNHFGV